MESKALMWIQAPPKYMSSQLVHLQLRLGRTLIDVYHNTAVFRYKYIVYGHFQSQIGEWGEGRPGRVIKEVTREMNHRARYCACDVLYVASSPAGSPNLFLYNVN